MMIYPSGPSFKKSKGTGFVQIKCEDDLSATGTHATFRLSIGRGSKRQPERAGKHNFAQSAVCGLGKADETWEFVPAVDKDTMTLDVNLTMML